MILADKIINLRKKAGWSQDELAAQLNVTRQSVSKWEGAQSVPDLERIVQLSRIFGVPPESVTTSCAITGVMHPAAIAAESVTLNNFFVIVIYLL